MLKYRVGHPGLPREQRLLLEKCEDELDTNVVKYRNEGITLLNGAAQAAIAEIDAAVKAATRLLKKIEDIKKAITVAVGLVDLARAILAKDISGIVQSAGDLAKEARPAKS